LVLDPIVNVEAGSGGGGATFVWRNVLGEWIVVVLRQTMDGVVSKDDVVFGWITRL
jgi:hypothetical protein